MKCSISEVEYSCGLGVVGAFNKEYTYWKISDVKNQFSKHGTGFFVAGFIDNSRCKEAYEYLCKETNLVYQSPVRLNKNSNNKFFFCIFDVK
jgi:hypothetical protein